MMRVRYSHREECDNPTKQTQALAGLSDKKRLKRRASA